jgi:hypothetical protein
MKAGLVEEFLDMRDGRDAARTALLVAGIPDEAHDHERGRFGIDGHFLELGRRRDRNGGPLVDDALLRGRGDGGREQEGEQDTVHQLGQTGAIGHLILICCCGKAKGPRVPAASY